MRERLGALRRGLFRVLRAVGIGIAFVVSFLLYWLLIGPYAVTLRIALGDLLESRPDARARTYWRPLAPHRPNRYRPF